jgi:aminopeptidase N
MVHEFTHQWFGDDVSPAAWSDVWLTEGHATWYQTAYAEAKGWGPAEATYRQLYRVGDVYRARYGPVAVPRGGTDAQLFNPDVYGGGALVLYALRQQIGAAAFATLERRWLATYGGRSASTADFVALASSVAGQDLGPFLRAWLYGTRTPPMPGHPDWTVAPATNAAAGALAQRLAASAPR